MSEQRSNLLNQVLHFRRELIRRGNLPEEELNGYLANHYGQAAQALLPLENILVTEAFITAEVMTTLARAFYRANELVQLTPEELREFSTIEQIARQLGNNA